MPPPIAVDIDGTMSRPDRSIDGRVMTRLRDWPAPVIVATGKAFPYPVALCEFVGVPARVIAENGGVVCVDDVLEVHGDRGAADRAAAHIREAGHDLGWDAADLANRWRETEVAVHRDVPRAVVDAAASAEGLEVIDSGYAYHVKSPAVNKGRGIAAAAAILDRDPTTFAAIGDSENDVEAFEVVGRSYAVENADDRAKAAADRTTERGFADGLLEALDELAAT